MSCLTLTIASVAILFTALASADDVLVFTDSNFEKEIKKYPLILVEFYAPWCGHCKRLAPEYEAAAAQLKKVDPPVPLAKVDCTENTNICSKFGVSGYPTVKIFKDGEFAKEYSGPREKDGIVKTMIRENGPVAKELNDAEAAEAFLKKDTVIVIGFFDSAESNDYKAFLKVADQLESLQFAYTFKDDVKKALKQEDGVVLYRPKFLQNRFEEPQVQVPQSGTAKMKSFIETEALGLCAERTRSNADVFGTPTFVAYFNVDYERNPKGTNYWRNRVMKVGKKLRDEGETVHFGISSHGEMAQELQECGLEVKSDNDKPIVCAFDSLRKKYQMKEEFSVDNFEKFVRSVLAGDVEPYLKSEPIPEPNDDPVKVVVAKNFDDIVNNEDKDVLIEFYAPWCGHCKSLAPKYDELAEKLKDENSVTIAKMDATANDVPSPYDVRGFPTIYYAPKGSKSSPKKYEGGREVKDFIKYLAKESTEGLSGFDRNGKKKKAKKEEL